MGIRENGLGLAKSIVDGFKGFDPAHPDSAAELDLGGLFRAGARTPAAGRVGPGPI
jgi:hypothetical protein